MSRGTKIALGVVGGILLVVGFIALMVMGGYNRLVTMSAEVSNQWAQVDNQLKRRSDLIPNLVSTVKGYAEHEKGIFTNIAEARSKLIGARSVSDQVAASQEVSSALSRLLAIAENYPALKADAQFLRLSDELAGTENRLAVERKRYNDLVKEYTIYVKRIPGRIYAAMFGAQDFTYYEVADVEKALPKVQF